MSLYNHVADKRDLLSGLVDRVAQEIDPLAATGNWVADVRAHAISANQTLRRHPWVCNLMLAPGYISPTRLRHTDILLARLREAGFDEKTIYHAYHALESHIFGFSLWSYRSSP